MTPKRYIRTKLYKTRWPLLTAQSEGKPINDIEQYKTPLDDNQRRFLIELETALRVAEAEELNRG